MVAGLAVLLVVNTVLMDNQTKPARVQTGRLLQLPGGDVQVREDGPRSGPPLVLLHCFACSLRWWDRIMPSLARDHHVIRVDLLGHGGSAKPKKGYSMPEQARRVGVVLDRLGIGRAVVVGHSMGGAVATALAELEPRHVRAVVIIDTPPDPKSADLPFEAKLGFVPVIGEAVRRVVTDGMISKGLESAFAPGFDVPHQFVADFRAMTYTSYDRSHDRSGDFGDQRPLDARLADVGLPLLVIFGARDQIADPDSAAGYRRVRNARVVILPRAGHSPNVEEPAKTASLISGFADRLQRRRAPR